MPTQREIMDVIRSTAEAVMESLKFLFVILMNLVEIRTTDQEQEIPVEAANKINLLLHEVQSQKDRIEEIARVLRHRNVNHPPRASATMVTAARMPATPSVGEEEWELEFSQVNDEEFLDRDGVLLTPERFQGNTYTPPRRARPASSQAAVAAIPKMPATPMVNPANAIPVNPPAAPAISSNQVLGTMSTPSNQQLALTAQALELWGNKRVSWGKKHPGSRFAEVYESDPDYLPWVTARAKTANAAMLDFIGYIQARQSLEAQAIPQNQQ